MEELKNITPNLSKMKKENPFGTPKHYFDDFSARMQMQIEAEKHVADKEEFKLIKLLKPAFGLAASFAIIFMLVYIPLKTFTPQNQVIETTVSAKFSDTHMQSILEELDETSFFSLLESDEKNETFSDDDLVAYVNSNFNAYEIFEYTEE